jgi:integrase
LSFRDKRLFEAFLEDRQNIANDLVFPSSTGTVLQPGNLLHRYFLPFVERAGLHRFRLHDLRHTFGSI